MAHRWVRKPLPLYFPYVKSQWWIWCVNKQVPLGIAFVFLLALFFPYRSVAARCTGICSMRQGARGQDVCLCTPLCPCGESEYSKCKLSFWKKRSACHTYPFLPLLFHQTFQIHFSQKCCRWFGPLQICYLLHVRNFKLETDSHLDSDFKDPELYTSLGSVLELFTESTTTVVLACALSICPWLKCLCV